MALRGWGSEPSRSGFVPRAAAAEPGGRRTYRMRWWGWRIVLWAGALGFAWGAVAVGSGAAHEKHPQIVAAMLASFAVLCAAGAEQARRLRVTIDDAGIELVSWRKPRRLGLEHIRGYRVLRTQHVTYLVFEPRDAAAKKLKVQRLGTMDDTFSAWLARLPDLDAEEQARAEAELLASARLGASPVERRATLTRARTFARLMNGAAIAVAVWTIWYPRPYEWAVAAAFGIPLVALVAMLARPRVFQGVGAARNDARPHLVAAILLPGFAGALRAFDFDLLAPSQLVVPALLAGAVLGGAAVLRDPEGRRKPAWVLLFVPLFALQGAGALTIVNCFRDPSPPASYEAEVRSKRVSRGKTTTWYLALGPWGPRARSEDVKVWPALYDQVAAGDRVEVRVRDGRLGFAWFRVLGRCR